MKSNRILTVVVSACTIALLSGTEISAQAFNCYDNGQNQITRTQAYYNAMAQFAANPVGTFYNSTQVCANLTAGTSPLKSATAVALLAQGAAVLTLCNQLGDDPRPDPLGGSPLPSNCEITFGPAFTFLYQTGIFNPYPNQRSSALQQEIAQFEATQNSTACLAMFSAHPWMGQ